MYYIHINFLAFSFRYNFTPLPLSPELTKATRSHAPCLSHAGHAVNPSTGHHVPPPSRVPLPTPVPWLKNSALA